MQAPQVVHAWPQGLPQALADLRGHTGLAIISVPTPLTASRPEARRAIRHALQNTVAALLGQPLTSITLLSSPGQPVQVRAPGAKLHIAISHMPGLSVAAICTHGPVGVDVMENPTQGLPGWAQVAHDYLGPLTEKALQHTPPTHRPAAFAQAWVSLEARLKCLGLGLTEWTPALEQRLTACGV
ncbi:MAG: 4'-phosphopantetheinyl transferase family protein, partial [Polaromonas sp.]